MTYRPESAISTNSSEVVRETVIAGLGIAMRSTWDISEELKQRQLVRVLDQFSSSEGLGIYAVYPSRNFLPAKVRLFIDFLAELFGPTPYWEAGLELKEKREAS